MAAQLAEAEAALATVAASRPSAEMLAAVEQAELAARDKLADASYGIAAIDWQIGTAKTIAGYVELARKDPVKAEAAWAALVERWTIGGQIAMLKPLTPEQFAAAAMQATGMLAPQIAAVEGKLEKSPPDKLKNASGADKPPFRSHVVQTELLAQLRGTGGEFVKHYGGLPGQDFQATVNQALFFGNGSVVEAWLKPTGENLVARLAKLDDSAALADEMYLSILSRSASETEKKEVAAFLTDRGAERPIAIGELVWALLSSTEFRFNH